MNVLFVIFLISILQGKSVNVSCQITNEIKQFDNFNNLTIINDVKQSNDSNLQSLITESTTLPEEEENSTVSQIQEDQQSAETIVYNRFDPSNKKKISSEEEEEEDPKGPEHVIPYSEHENPEDVPTKPKYIPGEWAKPPRGREVNLDFVPTKVYAQVRKTHTLRRLPRRKAIENAESEEEKENAARLREVVRNSKVNTVYTEEGYEDSAYDHAGHIRDADFHEDYDKKLREHLNEKQKLGDDKNEEEEEEETRDVRNFNDFDYNGSNIDRNSVNPKLVVEESIDRLQEDVEREAEDMEKGIEISKLEKVESTTNKEMESNRRRNRRPSSLKSVNNNLNSDTEEIETSQNIQNSTAVPLEENIESTTINLQDSSALYNINDHSNEPTTTVNYGKLVWDYLKKMDQSRTTPNVLQANLVTYSYEESTPFPIIEPVTLNLQPIVGQTLIDPKNYLKTGESQSTSLNTEDWQPIISNTQATTVPFSEFYDQQNYFSDVQKNLDSHEDSNKNFDNSFFNPVQVKRKPRYKIAIRHKTSKPNRNHNNPNQESRSSSVHEKSNSESFPLNENYMKVLKYLKNENGQQNGQQIGQQNGHLKRSNFIANKNLEGLTKMRPPAQKSNDYYYYYLPEATQSGWEPIPVRKSPKGPRKKNADSVQSRLSPRNDMIWYKEPNDYVNRGKDRSRDRVILGLNAKTREKRLADDESGGGVKGLRGNNAASNRGERDGKNPERNCPQKVTRRVQVGPVPDNSPAKLIVKKSRFNNKTSRIEESRGFERESIDLGPVSCDETRGKVGEMQVGGNQFKGSEDSFGFDEKKRIINRRDIREPVKIIEDTKTEPEEERSNSTREDRFKSHEGLLNAAPKIAEEIIEEEINDRFNNSKGENKEETVEVDIPEFDYIEELPEEEEETEESIPAKPNLDLEKYPFYKNEELPSPSALKYAINPRRLPKKSRGAMEFYNMRDSYKRCEEVEPKLEVLPEEEEPVPERGPNEDGPRLRGLGDKLDCFKAKYFDEDPFDNPLFLEEEIEDPAPPEDIDSKQFASRIMMFPKENEDYVIQRSSKRPENHRQPRRHNPTSVRLQKRRRVRYRTRRPTARIRKVQGQRVKHLKIPRKSQKFEKRPVMAASEISSFYTPYQNQVYEDVMGTIKNMANTYQVEELTTVPTSEEVTIINDEDEETKSSSKESTKSNHSTEKKGEDVATDVENSSRDVNIKGLTPPKKNNRFRNNYKRIRIPQKTRIQWMAKPVRAMKFRRKIRIYKRDLEDKLNSSYEEGMLRDSMESIERRDSKETFLNSRDLKNKSDYFNSEENQRKSNSNLTDMQLKNSSDQFNSGRNNDTRINPEDSPNKNNFTTKIDEIPVQNSTITSRTDRKSKIPKNTTISDLNNNNNDEEKDKSEKVYTIKDRIRYSRGKNDRESKKVGKPEKETGIEEDKRRREPRYNYIRRNTVPTPQDLLNSTDRVTEKITTKEEDSNNKEEPEEELKSSNKSERYQESIPKEETKEGNETKKGYAVHENVNEGDVATEKPLPKAPPFDLFDLKTFLESDPPGYTELSSDDFRQSFLPSNTSDNLEGNQGSSNSSENQKANEESSKTFYPSYFSNERSSEKSRESSEENAPSKESESEEKTFFRYESRPSSPAENYEDEKYSDLGPRVNKPSFFHPPFSFSNYKMSDSKESSAESEESDEETEDYVFPWYRDKKDEQKRKRKRFSKSTTDYEYPWERRERLAREEKKKREGRHKRLFDEDSQGAFSMNERTPRGRYRFWTRPLEDSIPDSTNSMSETRPVIKYSSRYNSKNTKVPKNEEKSKSVEEISKSIKKALEGVETAEKENSSSNKTEISSEEKKTNVSLNKMEPLKMDFKNNSRATEETLNSTKKSAAQVENRRRRRPMKTVPIKTTPATPTVKPDSRSRRRQKIVSETTTPISTTSASRTLRRRNQKVLKNVKQNLTEAPSNLNDTKEETSNRQVEQRLRNRRKRPNEIMSESEKNMKEPSKEEKKKEEIKKEETKKGEKLEIKKVNEDKLIDQVKSNEEESGTELKSDESFDFKDDRIESMSDFDVSDSNSDDDFEFGSILKTGENFLPPGRAVKLSQQESREIVSSVSWKSENYDF